MWVRPVYHTQAFIFLRGDFRMRKELPALFCRYALPQAAGLLLNSAYFIVDGMFIGNRLGREAMAAAGVAVPMLEFMIALSMAIASGCGVLVSLALARHRDEEARACAMHALIAAVAAGLLLSVLGNLLIRPLAFFLGSTEAILGDVVTYLSIILSLSPFMILSFLLGGLVRNDGHPVHAMGALAVGSLANIALDWLFMYPLDMGIAGAAWATALGPLLSCLLLLPHFLCRRGALFFAPVRPRLPPFGRMLGLGVPAFVMEFSIGMITAITNLAIGRLPLGEMGLAAYLLIGYLMLIILTLFLGMAEGLQPVFSQMKGKGDLEGLQGMRTFSQIVFVLIGGITCVLAFFFSRHFYSLFTAGDQALLDFTSAHSRAYFSGFVFAGINILLISFWQATEETGKSMLTALLRSALLPPCTVLLLPLLFGPDLFWFGHSAAEAVTCLAAVLLLFRSGRIGENKKGEA